MSPEALDKFYLNLATSLPGLQTLTIAVPPGMLKIEHVKLLLERCRYLSGLSIPQIEGIDKAPWKISHPSLQSHTPGFPPSSIAFLPSAEYACVVDNNAAQWNTLTSENLPNLTELSWISSSSPEQFLENVVSRNPRFSRLSLNSTFEPTVLGKIANLTHLRTLALPMQPIPLQSAQTLIQKLPWLISFSSQLSTSPNLNFSWLVHPRLMELTLKLIPGDYQAEAVPIQFTRGNLPSLRSVSLHSEATGKFIEFIFNDLECLTEVSLRFEQEQLASLEFSKCPILQLLKLDTMRLVDFKLTETEFFRHFEFDDVAINRNFEDSKLPKSMPRLEKFTYYAQDPFKSPEVCALVQKLAAAVPDDAREHLTWETYI
eukprot:TRINITY_DN6718_c0_g1_i1.p1 TRINITY_DN6718_c0_g1~~TRINITY_DN6718_c0_g1_i1.p1  ORF type:complete len:407 (+),score=44.64 TRINITY_DN6718_c0_g1_i1:105-1223(+)